MSYDLNIVNYMENPILIIYQTYSNRLNRSIEKSTKHLNQICAKTKGKCDKKWMYLKNTDMDNTVINVYVHLFLKYMSVLHMLPSIMLITLRQFKPKPEVKTEKTWTWMWIKDFMTDVNLQMHGMKFVTWTYRYTKNTMMCIYRYIKRILWRES